METKRTGNANAAREELAKDIFPAMIARTLREKMAKGQSERNRIG